MVQLEFGPLKLAVGAPPGPDQASDWLPYITIILEFLSSVVGALAWPALVVALVWIFRKAFEALLARLKGLIAPGVELAFNNLQEKEEEARESLTAQSIATSQQIEGAPDDSSSISRAPASASNTTEERAHLPNQYTNSPVERGLEAELALGDDEMEVAKVSPRGSLTYVRGVSHTPDGGMITNTNVVDRFDAVFSRAHSSILRAVKTLKMAPFDLIASTPLKSLVSQLDARLNAKGIISDYYESIVDARKSARLLGDQVTVAQLQEFEKAVSTFKALLDQWVKLDAARQGVEGNRPQPPPPDIAHWR